MRAIFIRWTKYFLSNFKNSNLYMLVGLTSTIEYFGGTPRQRFGLEVCKVLIKLGTYTILRENSLFRDSLFLKLVEP